MIEKEDPMAVIAGVVDCADPVEVSEFCILNPAAP